MRAAKSFVQVMVCWLSLCVFGAMASAQTPTDVNCSPANLYMVVDTSGSMSEAGKLAGLQQAASQVVNQFKDKLRLGLIAFSGGQARLLVKLGPAYGKNPDINGHAQTLLKAIQGLKADGDTPMTRAMDLVLGQYKKEIPNDPLHNDPDPNTKRRNFVLLVTDGEPSHATPGDNPLMFIQQLRKLAIGPKTYDILTFVVGLGDGKNIRTYQLSQYAKAGGTQNFLHALKAQDLAPYFSKISKTASSEQCNGRDDDCDGTVDEDIERECTNNCGKGKEVCHLGKWSKCDAPPPGQETCNGLDDNCNGKVDEGLSRACTTQCGKGTQSCIQGDWSTCTAPRPEPEICDGFDNDCDGQIDNGNTMCPGGRCVSKGGKAICEIPCRNGECPANYNCDSKSNLCLENPCIRKKCAAGEVCKLDGNGKATCTDPCAGVTCPTGKTCGASGTCIDCYQDSCAKGKICIQGKCAVDPCFNVTCAEGQGCRDGVCFDVCQNVVCGTGSVCVKGQCVRDACHGKTCPVDQVCVEGQCLVNKCVDPLAANCGSKQLCKPANGLCEDDPCARTTCPSGMTCFQGQCGLTRPPSNGNGGPGAYCESAKDCGSGLVCKNRYCYKVKVIGTPPIGCSQSSANPLGMSLIGLCLLLGLFRRRRRLA